VCWRTHVAADGRAATGPRRAGPPPLRQDGHGVVARQHKEASSHRACRGIQKCQAPLVIASGGSGTVCRSARARAVQPARYADGHDRAARRRDHAARLERLMINDSGPETEAGSNRITQATGERPTSFASLEEAIEFGIRTRPNLATLKPAQRREILRGGVRQQPMAGGRGRLTQNTRASACRAASSRGQHGPRPRRVTGPTLVLFGCRATSYPNRGAASGRGLAAWRTRQRSRRGATLPSARAGCIRGAGAFPALSD
jgi:hypothetical protein